MCYDPSLQGVLMRVAYLETAEAETLKRQTERT